MGVPVSAGDILCMAVGKRLEPGLSFDDFAKRYEEADSKSQKDVIKARRVLEEEHRAITEGETILPPFTPAGNGFEHTEFGHCIYVKAALMSEGEIVKHTSKAPRDLGLTPHGPPSGSRVGL